MGEWYNEIVVKKMSDTIYRITNATTEHMFLIVGTERAALLDTGGGYGDLWGAIRSVTDLPVTLYNTHVHPDHVGGNGFFKEAWYPVNDGDLRQFAVTWKARKGFMKMTRPDKADEFDTMPHVELPEDFVWHEYHDGDVFDLGGVTLRAIETPGHTRGSSCILHEQEKVLFVGDLLGRRTTLLARGGTSVVEFMPTLMKLQQMLPDLNWIYDCHNEGIIPKECIWNLLELCVEILNGTDDKIDVSFNGNPGLIAKKTINPKEREDGKFGNLLYNPHHLYIREE